MQPLEGYVSRIKSLALRLRKSHLHHTPKWLCNRAWSSYNAYQTELEAYVKQRQYEKESYEVEMYSSI